jgi:formylmethanofuran--tetrahydromethanopterin N-formyltransferase
VKAIGGGNILVCGRAQRSALDATMRAVEAVAGMNDVITPFPGGIVRSGSKVGSRYKGMFASTNDEYCPTLRGKGRTKLREGMNCVYEIVINGLSEGAIKNSMVHAILAATLDEWGKPTDIVISAGNYGGKLGKFHFKLHEMLREVMK